MGLITKEVEVKLRGSNVQHFENLGYKIPRIKNKYGKIIIPQDKTITVKVDDLSKGSNYRVDVECDCCGKILHIPYHKYYSQLHAGKHYCHKCALKIFNSGENNSNWRADLSEEERINKRSYPEYIEFIKRVFARDNYTCQCCGQEHGDLEVHHLNGYSWFIEGRTDETNAILLCSTCHANYHNKYGNKNVRKEDFEEWFGQVVNDLKKYNGILPIARKIYCVEEDKIYNDAKELQQEWNLKSFSSIYSVCNHQRGMKKLIGKHIFWLDEYETMSQKEKDIYLAEYTKDGKSVICITTGEIYSRIIDARKDKKQKSIKISEACNGKSKTAGKLPDGTKLQWMYYEDFLKLPQEEQNEILARNKDSSNDESFIIHNNL